MKIHNWLVVFIVLLVCAKKIALHAKWCHKLLETAVKFGVVIGVHVE